MARLLATASMCIAVAFGSAPAVTSAQQRVSLTARFKPDKLGASTTIEFAFRVWSTTAGQPPPPLTDLDLSLPAGLGLASSTLGLAECSPTTLLSLGLEGCPANARVGTGTARGEVGFGGELLAESAAVHALVGPPVEGKEQVLFYLEAKEPVIAELVFPGRILPSPSARFSGHLDTMVPIVPAWTDGPNIAVTQFRSTLGPLGLTYLRRVHGKRVPFHPKGISVPLRCPRGGFPFAASFAFIDGSRAAAHDSVPCPRI